MIQYSFKKIIISQRSSDNDKPTDYSFNTSPLKETKSLPEQTFKAIKLDRYYPNSSNKYQETAYSSYDEFNLLTHFV